jgi:hypothetical protein
MLENLHQSKASDVMAHPIAQEDIRSVKAILAEKDEARLTAILQLPHAPWPEAGPIRGLKYIR